MRENMQPPVKVLFVLPSLMSGGAERVLITLMNGLDRKKYTPTLLTVQNKGELDSLIEKNIHVEKLNKFSIIRSLPWLFKTINEQKPDVVISTMAHMNFAVLLLKPFLPKARFIVREAITPSFFFQKYKWRRPVIKMLYKFLYPRADIILSPTQRVFDEFRQNLGFESQKFTHLPNPVDLEHIRAAQDFPEVDESRKHCVHFIAAGRLEPQKGYDRLIEALANWKGKHEWQLTILGEGGQRQALEALISKHGLTDKVILKGLVKNPYGQFGAADCFLLPSRYEGLPNVVLESLACGAPVIATQESGGIDEIAKAADKGSVRIVQDMDAFLKAMEEVAPMPTACFRPSLLPEIYSKPNIAKAFDEVLTQVTS